MEDYKVWAEGVLQKVREKMDWCSEKNRDKIPYTTDGLGNYDDRSDETKEWSIDNGINWWTNGFWGGIMWLLYQDTKKEKYADIARISEQKLAKCFEIYYGLHHDVGFMFLPTAVADYRLTGNKEAKRLAMHGANLLAGRFNPAGNFIRAWNQTGNDDTRGWAIIDCMFNISLLYWASEESGDPRFRHIAMRHADTTLNNFIRPDGSVRHIVEFDPETGDMVKSYGGQGYEEGSAWTRGQGWAVYGFANSYAHTGKQEYLDAAKRCAHYCIANLPESACVGRFLWGLRDCGRAFGDCQARSGAGEGYVCKRSGEDLKSDRGNKGRLGKGLRCHCQELYQRLPQPGASFYHGVCGLLFYRSIV